MIRIVSGLTVLALTATVAMAQGQFDRTKEMLSVYLTQHGMSYDVDTLSDEQLAEIQEILNSPGGEDLANKAAIARILGLSE